MDETQIDNLARSLGSQLSRRGLGGLATGALAALGVAHVTDAKKKKKKKKGGTGGPGGGGKTCQRQCSGKTCGGDGCGGSCGTCEANERCNSGTCESYAWVASAAFSFLDWVQEIVTDSSGVLYIKDSNGAVFVKPQSGTGSTFFTQGSDIWDMAADNNLLYFTNYATNRVRIYSKAGVFQSQWGLSGTGAGQLNQPSAMAVGGGYAFVQDWVGDTVRVRRFDAATGNNPVPISPPAAGFGDVSTIAYGGGEFFVADGEAGLIYRYSEAGAYLGAIGGGSGPGKLSRIAGVTVDHNGHVLAIDAANYRVIVFTKTGEFVTHIMNVGDAYEWPVDLATFGDRVYVIYQAEDRHENSMDIFEAVGSASRDSRDAAPSQREQRHQRGRHGGKQRR